MWFSRRIGGKSICVYAEKQYMCKHLIDYMVALVCESLDKELHCFHLLPKTTKNSRRRKKQAFSLWLTPRFQQTGRTWATAGRRRRKKVTQLEAYYILIFNSWVLLLGTKTDMNSFIPMYKSDSGSRLTSNNIRASLHWKYVWRKDYTFGWVEVGIILHTEALVKNTQIKSFFKFTSSVLYIQQNDHIKNLCLSPLSLQVVLREF